MVMEILKSNFREKIHRESRLNRILKRGLLIIVKKAYKRLHDNQVSYKMIGRSLVDFVRIIRRIKKKLLLDSFRNLEKKNWSLEKDQNYMDNISSMTKSFSIIIKNIFNKIESLRKKEVFFAIKYEILESQNKKLVSGK